MCNIWNAPAIGKKSRGYSFLKIKYTAHSSGHQQWCKKLTTMGKIVQIKSIPKMKSATGVSSLRHPLTGKSLEKTKLKNASTNLQALPSQKIGGLKNGLSYVPWMVDGKQQTDKDGNLLTLQDKMEQKWGKPKGYFTNAQRSWRARGQELLKEGTYFQEEKWKMNDGSTFLDLDTMKGELGYHVALGSKLVANSYAEYTAHKWPKAQFYIAQENESEELKYSSNERRGKAIAALHSKIFTDEMRKKVAVVLKLTNTRATITNQQAYNLLTDFINNKTRNSVNLDKFEEIMFLLKDAAGKEEFGARYLLQDALDNRVIREKASTYTWTRAEGVIELGSTKAEALLFLQNPKKEALIEELVETIKAKKI